MLGALRRAIGRMRIPRTDKALGHAGERCAARMLKRHGYSILGRNVKMAIGEADIVCLAPDRATIVVIEVKTRRRGAGLSVLGETVPPEASVHSEKRRKLRSIAAALARANDWEDRAIRIDVVAIEWHSDGSAPTVRHHQGAGAES